MIKKLVSITVVLFILCSYSFAENRSFSIDGKYNAYFPEKPKFLAELGQGSKRHRSYVYTDEENLIIYTATYQAGITRFAKKDVPKALENYVKGQALSVGGKVKSYKANSIGSNESAIFSVIYKYENVEIRKFGVLSYKGGRFYQWSVQNFPALSKLDGKTLFYNHLNQFSVK